MIIALLLLFWIILSNQASPFFIIVAIASTLLTVIVYKKLFKTLAFKVKWHWILLLFKLLKDMLVSSFTVMKIILLNKKIESTMTWVDSPYKSIYTKVAHANAITLTPGTMSMKLEDNKILIHSIKEVKE